MITLQSIVHSGSNPSNLNFHPQLLQDLTQLLILYRFITNIFHNNLSTDKVMKGRNIKVRLIFDACSGRTWEDTLAVYFNTLM